MRGWVRFFFCGDVPVVHSSTLTKTSRTSDGFWWIWAKLKDVAAFLVATKLLVGRTKDVSVLLCH